jgi:hypothetical protein
MKSKHQRQKWWRELKPEQQAVFINKKVKDKAVRRLKKTLRTMKKYGDLYACSECFHRKVGCCTDDMPNGCEYWFNPKSNKVGLALL